MKVPRYEPMQVAPAGAVSHAPELKQPGGFGAIAQGLEAAGNTADKAVGEYQQAQHEASVEEARDRLTKLGDYSTDAFHGSPTMAQNNIPSFQSLQGKDAVAASTGTLEAWDKTRDDLAASLNTDTAKRVFKQQSDQIRTGFRTQVERHVADQVKAQNEATYLASTDEASRAAAVDPGNDELARQRIADVVGAAHNMFGGNEAETQRRTLEVQQKVAAARLDNLVSPGPHQDFAKAREVLDGNRYALGPQLDNYERALGVAQKTDISEQLASGILEKARKPNGFVDAGDAVAAWAALPPELRTKDAYNAFNHGLELAQKQELAVKAGKYNDALSAYLQRNNLNDVPPLVKSWMAGAKGAPGNDAIGWEKLERIANEDREHAKGKEGPTDAQRWAFAQFDVDLKAHPDKYAAMTPEQFKHTWWDQFSKGDRERAASLFATTHGEVKPEALTPAEGRMLLERGRDSNVFPSGNDVSKWDHDSALLYDASLRELEKRATNYRQLKREPPPFELVQKWTDELMQRGKIPGSGFLGFFQKSTTRLQAQEDRTEFEPTWTDDEKAKAVKQLQARHIDPTDDNVDSLLRIVKGMQPRPAKAPDVPKPPPRNTAELDSADADYGLDLTPTDAIGPGD